MFSRWRPVQRAFVVPCGREAAISGAPALGEVKEASTPLSAAGRVALKPGSAGWAWPLGPPVSVLLASKLKRVVAPVFS